MPPGDQSFILFHHILVSVPQNQERARLFCYSLHFETIKQKTIKEGGNWNSMSRYNCWNPLIKVKHAVILSDFSPACELSDAVNFVCSLSDVHEYKTQLRWISQIFPQWGQIRTQSVSRAPLWKSSVSDGKMGKRFLTQTF